MHILNWNPYKKRHPAALSGKAICPKCFGSKVKLVERLSDYVWRYQCKMCAQRYLDDMTPNGYYGDETIKQYYTGNPYAALKGLKSPFGLRVGVHKFKK